MAKVKLGEVAKEYKATVKDAADLPVVGLEHLIPGQVELTQWSEDADNTFTKGFKKGQMLFGRRRAYLKKAALAPFDGICSGDITVIEAIPERIMPELLPFVIQNDSLFDYAVEKSAGSLSPRVKWEHLKNYEFELPEMEHQRALVDLLWAMTITKKAYQELVKKTDELVKSQFIELFGDPETNPMNWEHMTLSSIVTNSNNGITRRGNDVDGQIVLRIAELQDGYIDYSDVNRIVTKDKEQKCLLVNRDLLFVRVNGNPDYVARSAIFEDIGEAVYHNDHIIRMHIDEKRASVIYVRGFITSDYGRKQLKDNVKTSAGQYSISQDGIGGIQIYLPPLEEQERYVKLVRQSDKSKFELAQAISRIDDMIKALMQG